jgi:hypothetical protein
MNKFKCFFASAASLFAFTCLSSPVGAALFQYSYTGNQFDNPAGAYSPQDHISIEFTIDESLVPRNDRFLLPESSIGMSNDFPVSMSMSDGRGTVIDSTGTYDDINFFRSLGISFVTDAEGNVNGSWNIYANNGFSGGYQGTTSRQTLQSVYNDPNLPNADSSLSEGSYYFYGGPNQPPGYIYRSSAISVENNPGTWTRTVIPLPGAMLFFVSTLVALCLNRQLSR